ncbi:MAG: hypothetical protein IT193_19915 [Propionibacteriaceae bacterium]|nr:hypothetical protein [Propionibacteriaceae bacterium]
MKLAAVLRLAAAALLTGALLVPAIGPAKAIPAYPPHVSVLYASPFVSGGYAAVSVSGEFLTSALTVRATRGSRSTVASVSVHSSGTVGTAMVHVGYLLSTTAGRYDVDFELLGVSVDGDTTTTQTYTVGKAVDIKSFKVVRKSYGIYISGTAAKSTPVKITILYVGKSYTKTYTKTVYGSSASGYFRYRFYKTTKGTYTVTAQVAPNKKYFSEPLSVIIDRT